MLNARPSDTPSKTGAPSLLRQSAAITYDFLAVLAVWFFATLVIVIIHKGQAIDAGNLLYSGYLLGCAYLYFAFCWTRGGQTLGMKSWKFALVATEQGRPVNWRSATLRFFAAIFSAALLGCGYWASLWHPQGLTWHDRLSRTRLTHRELTG